MIRALENPGTNPTSLEFFGFTRPPFARLSRPSQIFHTEQYSLLMAHLATVTEQPDCLLVICGADGSGKTTLLNRYIASLSDDLCFATIDETCNGEKQFYCAFLRQLGFSDITGTPRELRHITKEFLVHRGMSGDPVLIMIDNAHQINPTVLEQLRRISAIKVNDRRVLSVVLAGNSDLVRIMDSPAMSQIKFRSHIHFNIRVYTEEETANYVWHHLKLAGGADVVTFASEAHPLIHRYTGGVPYLINMLCNDVLIEANGLESRVITEELVRTVADNQRLLPHVMSLQGKGRRRTDPDRKLVQPERQSEARITSRKSTTGEPVENPISRSDMSDVDGMNLMEQISQLTEQVGELTTDRMRALQDIGTRDKDISELHNKLDTQTLDVKKLAGTLADNSDEIGSLNQALSASATALKESEKTAKKLAGDLQKERSAATNAQSEIAAANSATEELSHLKSELQATVSNLTTDLEVADERVAEIDVLEKNSAALMDEIEAVTGELRTLRGELDSRDEALGGLEKLLQESQNECASLRPRATASESLEESIADKDVRIADLSAASESLEESIAGKDVRIADLTAAAVSLEESISDKDVRIADLTTAAGSLEESVSDKDVRIADLTAELAVHSEEIIALEAKNEELELSDIEMADADGVAALESELLQANRKISEAQVQLAEDSKLIAQLETEARHSPTPENPLAASSQASGLGSAAEQSDARVTAFEIVRDGKTEQVMEIAEGQSRIMIGRSDDSELRLDSEFVSRHHALIFCDEQGLYIEDLNSFNGTIVNSKTITRCKLRAGDIVMIGDFQIRPRQA